MYRDEESESIEGQLVGRRRELDDREKDPAYVSDAYAECYPGYHNYSGTVVDSDEEDYTHMDTREKGRSRLDFDTEEQWQVRQLNGGSKGSDCS